MGSILYKKIGLASILFFILLFVSGCFVDVYVGKRPYDYPDTEWVCESPSITIYVQENKICTFDLDNTVSNYPEDLFVAFGRGNWMVFHSNSLGDDLFRCECTFSPHKLSAVVTKDDLFEGKYLGKTIVFYRNEANEGQ